MPISGPSSYLPTIDQFVAHWTLANAALGAGNALVLADGVVVFDLMNHRETLRVRRDAVTDTGLDRALARESLTTLVTTLQARLVEFNDRVRSDLPQSVFARVLPMAFQVGEAENVVREALRQMRGLWTKINAIAPAPAGLVLPFTLREGYGSATLETEMEALRLSYRALTEADQALRLAREVRNDEQDLIYTMLKNYRLKLPTAVAPGHALMDSLPALTPAGGHTPDAVAAQVAWNAATTEARVTYGASSDADLDHYEVRAVPGDTYNADDETVLATVEPGAAREFLTNFALSLPGLTVGFKVYVVLTMGNERGSTPVYLTRPV